MTAPLIGLLGVGSVALVAAIAFMLGSGDRKPPNPNCLPDIPRTYQPISKGEVVMPLAEGTYTVSSLFGLRDGAAHKGVDFAAPSGTPILASTAGRVAAAGPADGFGHWIIIDTVYGGAPLSTVYGHMGAGGVFVRTGDEVHAGQPIGAVGSDGESSGPHLHFEVVPGGRLQGGQQIDPIPWLEQATKSSTSAQVVPVADSAASGGSRRSSRARWQPGPATAMVGCDPRPAVVEGVSIRSGSVPGEYEPWIRKAAGTCAEVSAPLVAAQLRQESGFNRFAGSPAGAQGPAQFMPETWNRHGIDGDGDGRIDIYSIPDAVMSQAAYDCELVGIAKDAVAEGKLHGELTELWLSMYNCGPDYTLNQGGVCPNAETLGYVKAIPRLAAEYAAAGSERR
ncbi:peptidoglycan DD-metalloendopeptidase family protein [Nocardia colli]|uniref:Peptidoglycan DD-metalloendopeptidase family protein n=1 Tax=Nocardia colli TaxID=2545717 RepID=A0A5N0DMK0_9NOCA|nr:M23 family metallopeptidase [Nocardia colli]KAA8877325.1 peptidoglycan DD-metalloendopeptidase family protein [Nocardia colli]